MLRQETLGSLDLCRLPQGASLGASEKSGILWSWEGPLGTPLGLVQWKRASSPVEAGPQGTSPFLTSISESLQCWNRTVRTHLILGNGTPFASRVVHGVTGHLSSCIWNLRIFPDDALGCQCPFVLTSSTNLHSTRSLGIGFYSRADQEIGVFQNVAPPTRL